LSENSDIVHALDQIAGVKFMGINARELIGLSLILAAATPYLREALRFNGVKARFSPNLWTPPISARFSNFDRFELRGSLLIAANDPA
jgi:hypothetical protein